MIFSYKPWPATPGVSHRTVYRHYPTREALVEGLADYLDGPLPEERVLVQPSSAGLP